MEGESVLFIRDSEEVLPTASLLFQPVKILSVRSSSGGVTYEEGRDFTVTPGTREISLPEGSRIASKTAAELRRPAGSQRHKLTHRDGNGEILFGATSEYHDMQTIVSYRHEGSDWKGVKPGFAGEQLPRSIQKLQQKEPLKIALLGDSISTGCNASGWADVAPHQPAYQDLLVEQLQKTYRSPVTLKNFSVGGKDTKWGLEKIGDVIDSDPDLIIIAFGMNDSARREAGDYQAKTQSMIDRAREVKPDTEFILVASMLGNRDWTRLKMELFPQYSDALASMVGSGVALADVTSVWEEMLKRKNYLDLTGNGVNHPNDFGHRVYSQVLSSLLIPREF